MKKCTAWAFSSTKKERRPKKCMTPPMPCSRCCQAEGGCGGGASGLWGSYGPAGTRMQEVHLLSGVQQVAADSYMCKPVGIAGSAGSEQQRSGMSMQQALPDLKFSRQRSRGSRVDWCAAVMRGSQEQTLQH